MAVNTQELVEKYISIRDRKKVLVDKAKEDAAKFDTVLDKIEAILLKTFQEQGVDSCKTSAGTAYCATRTSATVADWEEVFGFISRTENWQMLDRKVNKLAIEAYREEHNALPPGVNYRSEVVVNVRRA